AAAGVRLQAHTRDLAVMGLVEVMKHLPFFAGLWRETKRRITSTRPDLIIPIDYPGFNLRLARFARQQRIPVLYFIAPQVWAWHRSRMKQLAQNVDRLAVILPFEEGLFRAAGADAHFVGHPLLDLELKTMDRATFARTLNIDGAQPILALFPGSRTQEVDRHLALFVEAARRVRAHYTSVQPVFAAAAGIGINAFRRTGLPHTDRAADLLAHARGALVKSGTTTLQAALALVPMVVTYQMHPLTFSLARRLVDVPHVALANLVAGEGVVPELIQDRATPSALAAALLPLLRETPERARVLNGLKRVRAKLAIADDGRTAVERVVALAEDLIEARA
ncbi:MAG TPA: lipid-A-disaccharide synthase, partial [Longimicrobiales bacterium]|nr:lipid-A-disaccharide synthase [Longimicrobiales bacterium]